MPPALRPLHRAPARSLDAPALPRAPRRRVSRAVTGIAVLTAAMVPSLAAVPSTAAPVPPTPSGLPRAVEALQPYVGQIGCDPVAKPGARAFSALLLATYRDTSTLGIVRDCGVGGPSEHKEGRAFDWGASASDDTQAAEVDALLDWLLAEQDGEPAVRARRLGIMYIIWDRQIWRAYNPSAGWQPYSGQSPHTDHVHFSFGWNGARQDTSWWTGRVSPVDYGPYRAGAPDLPQRQPQPGPAVPERPAEEYLPSPVTAFSPAEDVVLLLSRATSGTAQLRTATRGRLGETEDLGGTLLSEPVAVSRTASTVTTLARGADDALLVRVAVGDRTTPWYALDGVLTERPAASASEGTVEVVGRGRDGRLWHRSSPAAGSWRPWRDLDLPVLAGAAPAAVHRPDGRLEVFAVGEDSAVWHRSRQRQGDWTDWHSVDGRTADDVSAAVTGRTRVTLAVRGTDDRTWVRDVGRDSTGWRSLAGPELATAPTVTAAPGSRTVSLFAVGTDTHLYRVDRDEDGEWGRWVRQEQPD